MSPAHGPRSPGVARTSLAAAAAAVVGLRAHPRHLVLAALVAGLLAGRGQATLLLVVLLFGGLAAAALPGAGPGASGPRSAGAPALRSAPGGARPGLAGACVLAALAGGTMSAARLSALERTRLGPAIEARIAVHAVLLERPRPLRGTRDRAALVRILRGVAGRGERIVVRAARWPVADPGQEIIADGRLARLRPRDGWLRRRGAHARLYADAVRATGRRRGGLPGALDGLRRLAERGVSSGLGPPQAALARGMVLGQDEALDERTRRAFRDSGLAHLLAASGQNVMLLVTLALPVLAALGLGLRGRLAGCLALIVLYVPLAGAGPSIQRAGVMGAAGIVAALAGRPASRWYALLLAAAVTLALDPRSAADPGWQLSFAAVAAIALLAHPVAVVLRARGAPDGLAEASGITLAATLGTAPLLAFHFERVSLVSLPANLLAVPAVAPVMWLGTLAAASGAVWGPAAALPNLVAAYPLAYLGWLAGAAAGVPHASVPVALSSPLAVAATYLALAAAVLLALRPGRLPGGRRPRTLAGVAAALAAAAVVTAGSDRAPPPPDPRDVVVSFLDVGQGDATLVQHGGATVLVDAGPPGSRLLAHLRDAGVRRIDLLVVTHSQADHEGGAAAVLDRLPVRLLLDGSDGADTPLHRATTSAARLHGVRSVPPETGRRLRAGPIELRVLWPPGEPAAAHAGQDPNSRAVVAHVRIGEFDLLLPADAESDVTSALDLPAVEALKVAHHGSADPGTSDLLARLRPRIAVIEVGRANRYGHPTPETLAALRGTPAVHRTDRDGTVRLAVRAGRMRVATER